MATIKKTILFYNPNSGNGKFKDSIDTIIEKYSKRGTMIIPVRSFGQIRIDDIFSSMDPENYKNEYDQILIAGGDGTINLCVNAMIKHGIDLPIGILPAGTANDFAYYFGIPEDMDEMLKIAMGNHYTKADVGLVNGKYFVNVAAIGQVVGVSQKTNPALKDTIGIFAYYLKGLQEVQELKPIPVKLTAGDKVYEEDMYFMIVMNGKSAGGFKQISPESEINDGLLDVFLFRPIRPLDMAPLFMKLIKGTHHESPEILNFKTDKLIVESAETMATDVDGEKGPELPLVFSVIRDRLQIASKEKSD